MNGLKLSDNHGEGKDIMTPRQLERIGKRIWDGRWKSPLARALGMTYRTINVYSKPPSDKDHAPIPRTVELAVMWLDDNPEDARELGALD